jgi:hypothetical protein
MQERAEISVIPKNRVFRYGPPSRYDQHPYGTEIVVLPSTLTKEAVFYKQMSNDQDNPNWQIQDYKQMELDTAPY